MNSTNGNKQTLCRILEARLRTLNQLRPVYLRDSLKIRDILILNCIDSALYIPMDKKVGTSEMHRTQKLENALMWRPETAGSLDDSRDLDQEESTHVIGQPK